MADKRARDDAARERLRRAVEASAQSDQDEATRQRNAGVAIAVLALLVVGLLIAIVMGGFPGFPG
jgi:hypothetical protein